MSPRISLAATGLRVSMACALLAAAALTAAAAPSAASLDERYAEAAVMFRQGQMAGAYGRFALLADGGHVPSARIALLMQAQGRELFGHDWSASPDQRRRWNTIVINASRQRIELPDTSLRGD